MTQKHIKTIKINRLSVISFGQEQKSRHRLQCPDLFSLTQKLENSPQDLKLRLCLGEYARSTQGYNISYVTALEKRNLQL